MFSCGQRKIQGGESQSQNPFLSLLNGFGFYGTGVLGALYALARKEKAISDEALESVSFIYIHHEVFSFVNCMKSIFLLAYKTLNSFLSWLYLVSNIRDSTD